MKEQAIYVFLDRRTEDAALTLDPMKYQGVENWYQVGEVYSMSGLKELLSNEPFDPEYWGDLLEEMPREVWDLLNQE